MRQRRATTWIPGRSTTFCDPEGGFRAPRRRRGTRSLSPEGPGACLPCRRDGAAGVNCGPETGGGGVEEGELGPETLDTYSQALGGGEGPGGRHREPRDRVPLPVRGSMKLGGLCPACPWAGPQACRNQRARSPWVAGRGGCRLPVPTRPSVFPAPPMLGPPLQASPPPPSLWPLGRPGPRLASQHFPLVWPLIGSGVDVPPKVSQ